MERKDFLGREIKLGDTIVYPTTYGRRLGMSKGKVVGIIEEERWTGAKCIKLRIQKKQRGWNNNEYHKYVSINKLDRVVVVDVQAEADKTT